jgi:hypothetical protein
LELVEEEEKTLSEKWSWASRQATVPGARRPAGEEEKEEEVVKAERGPRERRRGPPTSRLRGAENGASWPSGWGRGAGKEGKVAGAAGAPRVWAASAGARCALLRLPGAARLGRLGSARLGYSALGRAAVPFSALPLIDWPACSATLANLAQRAALGGGGGRRGGGGPRRQAGARRAGPGREKTWKRVWIRSGQIHFLGGRTGRAALPRATRPVGLLPPLLLLGGGEPARRPPSREERPLAPGFKGPSPGEAGGLGLVPKPTSEPEAFFARAAI